MEKKYIEKKDKYQDAFSELKTVTPHFGMINNERINLANEITNYLDDCFKDYANRFDGKVKFGLSSSDFMGAGAETSASFDGRKEGEPLSAHISLDSDKDFTRIVRFASKLDYSGANINGNVVDLMLSPDFIKGRLDEFTDLIYSSIKSGFFQMQINVVNSKTLIEAKEVPESHPKLIVSVSGFSSYFNDLPEEYQDLLINRALKNEGKL